VALHEAIQRVLLIGIPLKLPPPAPSPSPPERLQPLIESVATAYRMFDERAVHFGHRYRSGFWAIYLLSALAVLFAVLPLALGWDDRRHLLHPHLGLWAVAEVAIIGTVSAIYWVGHRSDWQGQWLGARTTAELTWYLPMVAPLLDFTRPENSANWYEQVFDPGNQLRSGDDVGAICAKSVTLARTQLEHVWSDPKFIKSYALWTVGILEAQKHYHHRVAIKQHALLHRVHSVTIGLFGLTAVGVIMTGMGDDGAEGLGAIKAAGGMTIAQSEESCVVSGMPRAAILKGYANKVLPVDNLGSFLVNQYGNQFGGDRAGGEKSDSNDKSEKIEKSEKNERIPVSTPRT